MSDHGEWAATITNQGHATWWVRVHPDTTNYQPLPNDAAHALDVVASFYRLTKWGATRKAYREVNRANHGKYRDRSEVIR